MYDFHSHVLPNMDDGSRNVDESLAMLREIARQGVTHLAATPHFYPNRTSPDKFLRKRQVSWDNLAPHLESGLPQIKLGAEVHYYEGIGLLDGIMELCLEHTSLLLVEMPFTKWSTRMLDVLTELSGMHNIRVLLAHFELYLPYQSGNTWNILRQNGVLMQANADFFLDRRTRRMAMKMLKNGDIDVLGSDCHNMDGRKPNLGSATDAIVNKLAGQAVEALNMRGSKLFDEDGMD